MLKLTLKPGEFIDIGTDIRVVFSGGSANNIHLLVDAPKELAIQRNKAVSTNGSYYAEEGISKEAKKQIASILKQERKKNGDNADNPGAPLIHSHM